MHIIFKYCYWYMKHAYLSQATFGAELDHYLTTNTGYINQTFLGKTPVLRPGSTPQLHFRVTARNPTSRNPRHLRSSEVSKGSLVQGTETPQGTTELLTDSWGTATGSRLPRWAKLTAYSPYFFHPWLCSSAFLPPQHKTSRMGSIPLALFTTLYTLVISVLIICSTCFRIRT